MARTKRPIEQYSHIYQELLSEPCVRLTFATPKAARGFVIGWNKFRAALLERNHASAQSAYGIHLTLDDCTVSGDYIDETRGVQRIEWPDGQALEFAPGTPGTERNKLYRQALDARKERS